MRARSLPASQALSVAGLAHAANLRYVPSPLRGAGTVASSPCNATLCLWQARHSAATAASASQSSFDEADLEVLARSPVASGSVEELQAEEAVEAIEVRAGWFLVCLLDKQELCEAANMIPV